ncbi:MAG: hypothetical protein R2941_23145 [Desulfobacterales bacterium]
MDFGFGKQQAARTIQRWENREYRKAESLVWPSASMWMHRFSQIPALRIEQFCQLIRRANNGNAVSPRSEKNMLRMAEELGHYQSRAQQFFRILEIRNTAPEELDAALRKFAGEYREMLARLEKFHSDDPQIMALKTKAKTQLDAGCFDKAVNIWKKQ